MDINSPIILDKKSTKGSLCIWQAESYYCIEMIRYVSRGSIQRDYVFSKLEASVFRGGFEGLLKHNMHKCALDIRKAIHR